MTQLKAEVERLRQESKENYENYLRALADLENYRRRKEREFEEFKEYATGRLMGDLIPVLENLDRALSAVGSAPAGTDENLKGLREGIEMIARQLKETLARHGLIEYSALGEVFDPRFHEAVGYVESSDQPAQKVVEEVTKGYRFRDRVLRPALVTVVRPPRKEGKGGEVEEE